jgi:hypothetical protein
VSSIWSIRDVEAGERRKAKAAEVESLRACGFQVFAWDDLTEAPDGWLADADGRLWRAAHGEPLDGWQPDVHAAALGRGWLAPAARGEPRTLTELEAGVAAREAQQAQAARRAAQALEEQRKLAQPVTAAQLEGAPHMTLAEAAQAVEAAGGRLELSREDRLVVCLRPGWTSYTSRLATAAAVLYAAEGVVVAALKAKRALPDAEVTPNGALLP